MKFELKAPYSPRGDQPKAINELCEGLENKERFLTLLGVTGSGKTFTMASVAERLQRPVLVISPNKTLVAQLYREFKEFFQKTGLSYL